MPETDKIAVFCVQCGRDSSHQIGWMRTQAVLACPLCGNDVTGQMGQALMNVSAETDRS